MTPERHKAIQDSIIRVTSGLLAPVDLSKSHQVINIVGLSQFFRDIPRNEFAEVLRNMEGVVYDSGDVKIPTSYFAPAR